MSALIEGILIGLMLSVLVGPVFFKMIQISINNGKKNAYYFISGIFISDLSLAIAFSFGLKFNFENNIFNHLIYCAAAIVLVIFGINSFKKKEIIFSNNKLQNTNLFQLIIQGFIFNIINPSVIFFWISVINISKNQFKNEYYQTSLFIIGILSTVLITDIIKVIMANNIKKYLSSNVLQKINKVVGIILILSGFILAYNHFIKNP